VISDPWRNCFYTLTSKSTISVYKPDGEKVVRQLQTLSNIYKLAQDKAPASPALTPKSFHIVTLHVIDPVESRSSIQLHVVAVTSTGVRLYLSPQASLGSYGYGNTGAGSFRPLGVQHVRLPPSNLLHPDEQSNPHQPPVAGYGLVQLPQQSTSRPYIVSALDHSCYSAGLMIAAQPGDTETADYILCMSPDLTKIGAFGQVQLPSQQQPPLYTGSQGSQRPPLTEHATLLAIPGRTWAMAPAPHVTRASPPAPLSPVITNELAYQFCEPSRQFMILTNAGLTYLAKRRALDYLKDVVEEAQEGNPQPIIQFRDR
jgi:nuclear pore complex protein Nup155